MTNEERLSSFAELADNWDSYGAKPIMPGAIDVAKRLLPVLPSDVFVVPLPDGGVQLEWTAGGDSVEIEVHVWADEPLLREVP